MTFKELVDAITEPTDGSHFLQFYSYWFNSPGAATIPYDKITDDTPVEIVYYWNYWGMLDEERKQVKKAIDDHDYSAFCKLKNQICSRHPAYALMFPDHADIYFPTISSQPQPDNVRGHIEGCWGCNLDINHPNTFKLIELQDSENG